MPSFPLQGKFSVKKEEPRSHIQAVTERRVRRRMAHIKILMLKGIAGMIQPTLLPDSALQTHHQDN